MITDLFRISIDSNQDWLWYLLASLCLLAFTIQLYYFVRLYLPLIRFKKVNVKSVMEPVSVIICARNEAANLKRFLPSVLNQFYPEFQVIVVNDGSTDESADILSTFKEQYKHLYITGIEPRPYQNTKGKKLAQTIGIKAAKFDQLLFIDADCEPVNPNWIRHMQSNFLQQTQIVLGYGKYIPAKGLLNKWIRIDTVFIAMQYMVMSLIGKPFLGVGRNLAYRKSLFFERKGFASHLHLASGDDDLFVNENADRYNTVVEIHPESFTQSLPKTKFKNWIRQKKRHLTTGMWYKKEHRRFLGAELLSRMVFYLSAILLLTFYFWPGYIISLILLRIGIFAYFFKRSMKRLNERNILVYSLFYDLVWPLLGGILFAGNILRKGKSKW